MSKFSLMFYFIKYIYNFILFIIYLRTILSDEIRSNISSLLHDEIITPTGDCFLLMKKII
jgi:hypothetical protein